MKDIKIKISAVILCFCCFFIFPTGFAQNEGLETAFDLPQPLSVDISLECTMARRMSVREFTDEDISLDELSTILWSAYGYREDKTQTVPGINGEHAAVIYVFTDEFVYFYDAYNHSLDLYMTGDYRDQIAQYQAPIQLGIMWNPLSFDDENLSAAEIGQIGQNIQFMAVALDLGTVVTAERPSPLDDVGLPSHLVGRIVMPLGHPEYPYDFVYRPLWFSLLPKIQSSSKNVTTLLQTFEESSDGSEALTRQQQSNLLWSTYGYSPLLDNSDAEQNPLKRHRTVPSAHGYYPLRFYIVTQKGIFRYIPGFLDYDKWGVPVITFLLKIRWGDHRQDVADASDNSVASAPFIIISVLDIQKTIQWDDLSSLTLRWVWFYEAGASTQNVLLEATALDCTSKISTIDTPQAILDLLRLSDQYQPLLIQSVGS